MNELERFKAVVHFEQTDYWPLVTMGGLGFIHRGGLQKLHREGLPEAVNDIETWCRYWGQCTFDRCGSLGTGAPGIKSEKTVVGEFEIIRYETGAVTRQVLDNDMRYSMPDFQEFHVRDRASWERYKQLTTPTRKRDNLAEDVKRFSARQRPLAIAAGGTWGVVRNWMGPERALLAVYDDPGLLRDMVAYQMGVFEEFTVPVIERLRPEVITMWEDFCYNHGMLISPSVFREFCAPFYRRVAEVGRACGTDLMIVDCDGKVDEFIALLIECGINGCWPLEQVCGNDPREYRRRHPRFILAGGIEKEIANSGNGYRIERELSPKVTEALKAGGYFPMFDHALQVDADFSELCRCMTQLHAICGSDLGEFPRRR
ncbi:MAG: hypothetical protein FJ276_36860 [Planctomycetes bacterium]|nr:hypothetical protein [Planctomycetota bacterium]